MSPQDVSLECQDQRSNQDELHKCDDFESRCGVFLVSCVVLVHRAASHTAHQAVYLLPTTTDKNSQRFDSPHRRNMGIRHDTPHHRTRFILTSDSPFPTQIFHATFFPVAQFSLWSQNTQVTHPRPSRTKKRGDCSSKFAHTPIH